jgi:hypothetical protein
VYIITGFIFSLSKWFPQNMNSFEKLKFIIF